MGQGTVWEQGGNWWIRWRERGRRRAAKFPTRELAEKVLARIIGDLAAGRGSIEVERPPVPQLGDLFPEWIERRKLTVRSWRDDASRWRCHLGPFFGRMLADEVTVADIRRFVESRIRLSLSRATIRLCVALLSAFYSDLLERELVPRNVVKAIPRAIRKLIRPDSPFEPFLERQEDIQRVFLALPQPFATMFAVGVLAGLRPGEVLALEWGDVDLRARRILVQRQARNGRVGPPKSGKARSLPMAESLANVLGEWRLATGGGGQLFRPAYPKRGGHPGAPARFLNLHTVLQALRRALKTCGLPESLTLYGCSRHTYAAHFVLGGGSLSALRELLGHHSASVTERYGRLRSEMLNASALPTLSVDFSRPGAAVIDMAAHRDEKGTTDHAVTTDLLTTRNGMT
jgi:integrase